MSRDRAGTYLRFLAVFAVLGVLGIGAVIYILVQERFTLPFQNLYSIRAQFSAADGVLAGTGQPVLVAGVKVGAVSQIGLHDGNAIATLQLDRDQVPHVYADATVTLVPVSPLGDMSVELSPGAPPARRLSPSTPIAVGQTASPLNSSALDASFDTDTRDYLTALLSSLGEGVGDRGPDLRRALIALGPTVNQLGQISRSLADRRTELAQFVHNLGLIAHAASQDGQIPAAITAGNETLQAITSQDHALRQTLIQLPGTMNLARTTLTAVRPFAQELGPSLAALTPAVRRLPATLHATERFSRAAVPVIRHELRPLVSHAIPYLGIVSHAMVDLRRATPDIIGGLQSFNYLLNELDYVPGGGDEGFLFWIIWALHDTNSVVSTADANGTIGRGLFLVNCDGLQQSKQLQSTFALTALCPK